jgi:outer membrane protein insertion porin family
MRATSFLVASAIAAAGVTSAAGCGGAPPPAVTPAPKAPASAEAAVTSCPTSLAPGGDPLEAESFEGKRITRVCILGTEAAKTSAARAVASKEGDTFALDRARADLEAIMALGHFEDAQAHGIRSQGSVVLLYTVKERPRVADIAVVGAKSLGDAALTAKLPIEKGAAYEPSKVNVVAQAIRSEYRSRGYDACKVKLVTETVGEGQVRVRIAVDEGPLWKYSKIELKGASKVPEADLRKAAALTAGKTFVQDEVDRAAHLMSAVYYDRGFVQVRLNVERGAVGADGGVPVTFTIEEGDRYAIGALHATKAGAPVEKELLEKVVRLKPKQTFGRTLVVEDMERIKKFFAAREQTVEINPQTKIDEKKKTIDLTFEIEESP